MRRTSTTADFAELFRNTGIGNISTAKGLAVIAGRRRNITLVAQWAGDPRRHRDWHVSAYHTIPRTTRTIKAEASHFGARWQAAELALMALEIEISTAKGLAVIAGRRRNITLVAQWAGDPRRHRDWHVSAYHTIPRTTRTIKAEASHFGARWQAAELALMALKIEIEREGI